MNVLVIPEDSRKDKVLLKPLIEAMMAKVGKPHAQVRVCENPVLGGVAQALKPERILEIINRYRSMIDLFLLIVDRDGEERRREALTQLEALGAANIDEDQALLGEHAIEEVEVWVLAGHDLPSDWKWREVRAHPHPKEAYFAKFMTEHRKMADNAAGRAILAEEAASHFQRMCDRCPEDLRRLTDRVRALL